MKNYIILIVILSFLIASCDEDDERLDFLDSSEYRVDEFYAWESGDTVKVTEGSSGIISLSSIWTLSTDPTYVEIEISGDAASEIGDDISVSNVTEIGDGPEGNIDSVYFDNGVIYARIDNADTLSSTPLDLQISVAEDGVTDGDKYLTFTLKSVMRDGVSLGVGDNNGERVSMEVVIVDVDCPSELAGAYTAGNSCYDTDSSTPDLVETTSNGIYNISDFTGGFYAFAGAPEIAAVMKDACGNLSIDDFVAYGVLEFENMTGVDNGEGTLSITWTEASGYGNGGTPVTCTTTLTLE